MERIQPRKEVPAGTSNSLDAFLAMAAPEEALATQQDIILAFKKMMDEMGRGMEAQTQELNEASERMTRATEGGISGL